MRAILCLMVVPLAFAGEWSKAYKVTNSPNVSIRCHDANVDVRAGTAGQVQAHVLTRGIEIQPGEVEVIERQTGDRIEIEVKIPKSSHWNWNGKGSRSIGLDLNIPSNTRLTVNT